MPPTLTQCTDSLMDMLLFLADVDCDDLFWEYSRLLLPCRLYGFADSERFSALDNERESRGRPRAGFFSCTFMFGLLASHIIDFSAVSPSSFAENIFAFEVLWVEWLFWVEVAGGGSDLVSVVLYTSCTRC